jgi:hypothetical protein
MGSFGTTVTMIDAFAEVSATDVAVIATVAGVGTEVGAMKSPVPEPMVPALDGEIDHVTFWFAAPETVAESCQFAPTPIGQGFVNEAAQAELEMLTVTGGGGGVLDDEEPPQAASERRLNNNRISV